MNPVSLFKIQPVQRESYRVRAYLEADRGWAAVALRRLEQLLRDYPDDAKTLVAIGHIRESFLGEGLGALAFYERAFAANPRHPLATAYATMLARDEQEFAKWVALTKTNTPESDKNEMFEKIRARIVDQGEPYAEILREGAALQAKGGEPGRCAAILEIVLRMPNGRARNSVETHRYRAQALRALDAAADRARKSRIEYFAPDERLALHNAVAEIDRAIELDPYDAELWNLKAAWLVLLERHEEAVGCADEALKLRPRGYPKPYQNKAAAYLALDRLVKARLNAEKALEIATTLGSEGIEDVELAKGVLSRINARRDPTDDDIEQIVKQTINAARRIADELMAVFRESTGCDVNSVAKGLYRITRQLGENWNHTHVLMMCEFLADFPPEVALALLWALGDRSQTAYRNCVDTVIYIAAHAEDIMRRDAGRLMALLLLACIKPHLIRRHYREIILATAGASDEFAPLADSVGEELRRLNPLLYKAFGEQPPLTESEIVRAREMMLPRFRQAELQAGGPARGSLWSALRSLWSG